MKNYIELSKKEYPKVESLSKDVFGYKDTIEIHNNRVWISFMCDQKGIPLEGIWNSYFNIVEKVDTKSPFWLVNYKKDLLNKIIEDLENKKQQIR